MRRAILLLLAYLGGALAGPLCQTYTVKSGDSVWSIADSLQISQDALTGALAQCIGYTSQTVLQVGQSICLPPYYPDCIYVSNSGGNANCKYYVVQSGDTLSGVAAKFSVYINDLQSLNSDVVDGTSPLRVGQKLRLPPWPSTCPDPNDSAPSCRVYVVKSGDYMAYIAAGFDVAIDDLLAVNTGLNAASTLSPGQRVNIPPFDTKTCGAGKVTGFPTEGVTLCRLYAILKGDTLSSIAVKFGTTAAELISLNPQFTDPSLVQPGTTIKIPKWDATCTTGVLVSGSPAPPSPPSPPSPPPSPPSPPSPPPSPLPPPSPSPSPSPSASAGAPTPAPSVSIPSTSITVNLTVAGASETDFSTRLSTPWLGAMADLANVPVDYVSILDVSPAAETASRRRLQADASTTLDISTRIATSDPSATQAAFDTAANSGELAQELAALNLTLVSASLKGDTAPAPSTTAEAASAGSSSATGAIVGGVVGGVVGLACVASVVVFLARRRRGGPTSGAAPALAGGSATFTTKGNHPKLHDVAEGHSSSPRALTPRRVNNVMA